MDKEELLKEYNDFKRRTINPLEKAGDFLTGIDERLDYIIPKMLEMFIDIKEIKQVASQLPGGGNIMQIKMEQIPYSYTLAIAGAAGSAVKLTEYAPFNGYIETVTTHFPEGANALCDIKMGVNQTQLIPREDWLSLNNATPQFHPNWYVKMSDEIWVEMQNRDGGNPHTITVIIDLRGAE